MSNNLVVTLTDELSRDRFIDVLRRVNVDPIDINGVKVTIPGDAENKLMAIMSYPQSIWERKYRYGWHHENL